MMKSNRRAATLLSVVLVLTGAVSIAADGVLVRGDLTAQDAARVGAVTAPTTDFTRAEPFEAKAAGAGTSTATVNRDAFSHFSANLDFAQQESFKLGNALFRKLWVSSPSSTLASDGLGPLYNARACQSCHVKDGRGRAPDNPDEKAVGLFLRLSVPPSTDEDRKKLQDRLWLSVPEPVYGQQLQTVAVPGLTAEAELAINYTEQPVTLSDGETASLRHPAYQINNPAYGPLSAEVMISPRVAPPMIGLGLLEAIHPADILANADPNDQNGDGISGRPAWVRNAQTGEVELGRFGWKAGNISVRAQSASAFAGDIGLSSPEVPSHYGDCTAAQTDCFDMANGVQTDLGDTELPDPIMDLVTFYAQNLAVPVRRDVEDPSVLHGKQVFYETGCAACHVPKYVTRRDADDPLHAFQLIWPYTDMLLHDMGDGLADNRPDGDASGMEWRTPPLWGIGLTETIAAPAQYLHDGRARTLLEAILWHGGEAAAQRQTVIDLPSADRTALIKFLESL